MAFRLDMLQMFNPLLETKYNPQTIEILLEHYYLIENNINFRHLKYDLDNALVSERLTGDMRRLLFVRYNLQLNIQQALRVLVIDYKTYIEKHEQCLIILSQECEQFQLNCDEHIVNEYMVDTFEQLEYKTANVMRIKARDTEGLLYELGDNLMLSALGVVEDNQTYTNDISRNSKDIYITQDFGKKNNSNDEFYRSDLNRVFYGEDSLLIAELDALGRDYY